MMETEQSNFFTFFTYFFTFIRYWFYNENLGLASNRKRFHRIFQIRNLLHRTRECRNGHEMKLFHKQRCLAMLQFIR